VLRGDEDHVARVLPHLADLDGSVSGVGVTDRFRQIIDEFKTPAGETRRASAWSAAGTRRDGQRRPRVRHRARPQRGARPTPLIFSMDSANPGHRDRVPVHIQTKAGETTSSDTGHLPAPSVCGSVHASWMTHAIRGTGPAVPMLTG
jgi:hypothetical protein